MHSVPLSIPAKLSPPAPTNGLRQIFLLSLCLEALIAALSGKLDHCQNQVSVTILYITKIAGTPICCPEHLFSFNMQIFVIVLLIILLVSAPSLLSREGVHYLFILPIPFTFRRIKLLPHIGQHNS